MVLYLGPKESLWLVRVLEHEYYPHMVVGQLKDNTNSGPHLQNYRPRE